MDLDGSKRRRLSDAGAAPVPVEEAAAGGPVTQGALPDDLRTSLDEAASVSLAVRARESAADMLAQSAAADATAARATAAAAALARRLGVDVDVPGGVDTQDGLVSRPPPTVADSPSGEDAKNAVVPRAPSAGNAAPKGEPGSVTVLDLPDAIVERLFELLADEGERSRTFPCNRRLFSFGFSCSRFSQLFRKSYIRELHFFVGLRFARDADIYHEAVSGALMRFSSANEIAVVGSDCVWNKALVSSFVMRKLRLSYPLGDSPLPYRLAVAARRSISTAATNGLTNGASAITKITFERERWYSDPGGYGVHASHVSKKTMDIASLWKWEAEQERWLDYFPHVTTAVFGEFETFCTAPRLCGPSKLGLKNVSIWLREGWVDTSVSMLLELVQFRNIETLAIRLDSVDFAEVESSEVLQQLPTMVEMLPKLQNFGLRCCSFYDIADPAGEEPVLKLLFCDPASPVDRRLKLTICGDNLKEFVKSDYEANSEAPDSLDLLSDRDLDALCFEEFGKTVVGQFHSQWKATEIFGESIVGKPELGTDMCVDLRFLPV